jgi:hypothetical protein
VPERSHKMRRRQCASDGKPSGSANMQRILSMQIKANNNCDV